MLWMVAGCWLLEMRTFILWIIYSSASPREKRKSFQFQCDALAHSERNCKAFWQQFAMAYGFERAKEHEWGKGKRNNSLSENVFVRFHRSGEMRVNAVVHNFNIWFYIQFILLSWLRLFFAVCVDEKQTMHLRRNHMPAPGSLFWWRCNF